MSTILVTPNQAPNDESPSYIFSTITCGPGFSQNCMKKGVVGVNIRNARKPVFILQQQGVWVGNLHECNASTIVQMHSYVSIRLNTHSLETSWATKCTGESRD
jgi:hypothetical protein